MKIELNKIEDTREPVIKRILDELEKKKKKAISLRDEELANNCWRESESLKVNVLYIQAFEKIKARQYRSAWNDLERCEIDVASIERNSVSTFFINSRCHFIKEQVTKWQSLYPYHLFFSPGFKVGYYTCGICNHKIRPRSRCSHIKGEIYNGELCVHIAHDMEIVEISLVTKPVQKYSVAHKDEELDFSLVNYPSELLDNAFENWDVCWTHKSFPIEKFSQVDPSADCPCKNGKKFFECCINEKEILIPHVDFSFYKEIPEEKTKIRFPY